MLFPTASPLGFCYLCLHPWERASLWPDSMCWLCKAWQLLSAFCVTVSNLPGDKIPAWPDLLSSRFCATVSQVQGFQGWHFRSSFLLLCTKLDFCAHSVHLEQGWVHHLWDSVQNDSCRAPCSEIKNDRMAAAECETHTGPFWAWVLCSLYAHEAGSASGSKRLNLYR